MHVTVLRVGGTGGAAEENQRPPSSVTSASFVYSGQAELLLLAPHRPSSGLAVYSVCAVGEETCVFSEFETEIKNVG